MAQQKARTLLFSLYCKTHSTKELVNIRYKKSNQSESVGPDMSLLLPKLLLFVAAHSKQVSWFSCHCPSCLFLHCFTTFSLQNVFGLLANFTPQSSLRTSCTPCGFFRSITRSHLHFSFLFSELHPLHLLSSAPFSPSLSPARDLVEFSQILDPHLHLLVRFTRSCEIQGAILLLQNPALTRYFGAILNFASRLPTRSGRPPYTILSYLHTRPQQAHIRGLYISACDSLGHVYLLAFLCEWAPQGQTISVGEHQKASCPFSCGWAPRTDDLHTSGWASKPHRG